MTADNEDFRTVEEYCRKTQQEAVELANKLNDQFENLQRAVVLRALCLLIGFAIAELRSRDPEEADIQFAAILADILDLSQQEPSSNESTIQ